MKGLHLPNRISPREAVTGVLVFAAVATVLFALLTRKSTNPYIEKGRQTPDRAVRLSDLDPLQYVSLPDLENMPITEEELEAGDGYEELAFEKVLETAAVKNTVDGPCTAKVDFTASKGEVFVTRTHDAFFQIGPKAKDDVFSASFLDHEVGDTFTVRDVQFMHMGICTVQITIKGLYDMPYPVTDAYMASHTQYPSLQAMAETMRNADATADLEAKRSATVASLLSTAISRSSFIKIPADVLEAEREYLDSTEEEGDPDSNMKKALFLEAVVLRYGLATEQQMKEKIVNEAAKLGLEKGTHVYDRLRAFLWEDEVLTFLYKHANIQTGSDPADRSNWQKGSASTQTAAAEAGAM